MGSEVSETVVKRPHPAEDTVDPPQVGADPRLERADVLAVTSTDAALTNASDLTSKANTDLLKSNNDGAAKLPNGFPSVDLMGFAAGFVEPTAFEVGAKVGAALEQAVKFALTDGTDTSKNIKTDDKGRVTEVSYPDGRTRQFGYDPNSGQMNRIVQPDGQVYVLGADGKWSIEQKQRPGEQPPNPKPGSSPGTDAGAAAAGIGGGIFAPSDNGRYSAPRDLDFKNPAVAADGTFTYETNDGSKVKIPPDGTKEVTTKDGAVIKSDDKDRVTEVRYPNGDTRTFSYDTTGKLRSYTENGKRYDVRDLGEVWGPDGKSTGMKNPRVGRDGSFTITDAQNNVVTTLTDRTSNTAKGDGSFVKKNADGNVTEVTYPDGRRATFGYDGWGRLNRVTDADGKEYNYKATLDLLGVIRFGSFTAADGSTIDHVSVKPDGTLQYTDKNGKIQTDYTSGNRTTTDKTEAELRAIAAKMHETNWFFTTNSDLKDTLKSMSHQDRVALDEQYKKMYGQSLSDKLRGQEWNPLKRGNTAEALDLLTESHLRTEVLKNFDRPEDVAKANKLIDEFRERARQQGVPLNKMDDIQQQAIDDLQKGGFPEDQLKKLERALTDRAPTLDSLNAKYGVKFDEVKQPDGTTVRKYYVEGENGAKLPVLDTNSDNPAEVERRLKEWQDTKMKELEQKYNVQFSRDGQKDSPLGREVNLRSPRVNELMAMEEGLAKSQPSTTTLNGKPILVQFAVEPTSAAAAYVLPKGDQQRILFEPVQRDYTIIKDNILHEWAHNAQHTMETRDKAALDRHYAELGYRKVSTPDGGEQWQFRDKDGKYWAQGPDQPWHGTWTRVDDQGRPLKTDGTLASGWGDPQAANQSNSQMRDNADVKPSSVKDYFTRPWEGSAESIRNYRSSVADRTRLYVVDPKNYESTKKFDQAELDSDPRYGRNPDGTSKYIRLPDGTVGENNEANRKAVADFEATLPAARAAAEQQKLQQQQQQRTNQSNEVKPGGGKLQNKQNTPDATVLPSHDPGCMCGNH